MSRRGRHDAGEDFIALSGKIPIGPVRAGIQQQNGFTTISEVGARRRFSVRRTNHSGCLAFQTVMVCRVESRSDDQSRPGSDF
jgi:hypothetical protein